jgi:hypothetical protein
VLPACKKVHNVENKEQPTGKEVHYAVKKEQVTDKKKYAGEKRELYEIVCSCTIKQPIT